MNRDKMPQVVASITFVMLLLVGCGAPTGTPALDRVATGVEEAKAATATLTAEAPTAIPTATATPIPPTATATLETATAAPAATAEAPSDLQPLSAAECSDLADAMSQTLGIPGETAKAAFQDHVSQRMGTGCQTTITGTGLDFESVQVVLDALRRMIQAQGWYEDFRYGGGGPTGELTGFRQANKLCLSNDN